MPKKGTRSSRDEKLWDEAKDIVRSATHKGDAQFTNKDWGFVNHIYHTKKKSIVQEILVKSTDEMLNRVVASSTWSIAVGQIKERLFDLYEEFNGLMKTSSIRDRETYAKAYVQLMNGSQHEGLLRDDEGSFEEFLDGYREFYES